MPSFYLRHDHDQSIARAQARDASAAARDAQTAAHFLEDRVERLALACEAMWTLLKERTGMSDRELHAAMAELDLADGAADGKLKRGPRICAACNRPNSPRHFHCIYCGENIDRSAFE